MPTHERPLIGSVFERTTPRASLVPTSKFAGTPGTGFPTAQHRSKSAFARARDEVNAKGSIGTPRRTEVPPVLAQPERQPQSQPQRPPQPPSRTQTQAQRPCVAPTSPIIDPEPIPTEADALRRQIHEENARTIARMSDADIEREKRAILEQLGEGTERLLRRVEEARRRKEREREREKEKEAQEQAVLEEKTAQEARGKSEPTINADARPATEPDRDQEHVILVASPTPRRVPRGLAAKPGVLRVKSLENIGKTASSPLPMGSSTRPSSRTGRKLRFAEVTPDNVHVYESAPISPKRTVLALPPPPDTKDDSIVSLGRFHEDAIPSKRPRPSDSPSETQPKRVPKDDEEPEEGTPEYIRRRYFSNVPTNDPSLAWMQAPSETSDPSATRFDLHGAPIPASLSATLPSHLGLHHHAEGSSAGYTIDDIFLLSRSTVPAQRASMLGVLAKIARRLGQQLQNPDSPETIVAFVGQERELRKRILASGLAALDQIGSLGARAVEVVWECLVEWDGPTIREMEGVELVLAPDVVSSLQLDYLLPRITDILLHATLPPESLGQLLAVVYWLAQQSNQVADMITNTSRLVPTILNTFLLTPIPPKEDSVLPNPLALQLLVTLASASRSSASALLDPADALLRFVTLLPPSSPYPTALATTLLTYTLRFYTTLSSYGLYSHIATTASQIFTALVSYIVIAPLSPPDDTNASNSALLVAWASLVETWTVCATDPHATSPPHEFLWSQLCALGWTADVRKLGNGLGMEGLDWNVYAAIWDAESAWLEGARINGIKGGEREREEASRIYRITFATKDGTGFAVVRRALEAVQCDIGEWGSTAPQDRGRMLKSLASVGGVLASALRLWLACLPPLNDGLPLSTPPFALPFSELSALSAALVKHPIWSLPLTPGASHLQVCLRPLTRFIIYFHRVSRHIPGTTPQLWFAQALVFLSCLLPGDESPALAMLDAFLLVTPQFVGADPAGLSQAIHMDILRPFFEYGVRPEGEAYVAPSRPSTESILRSSTLRLPPSPPSSRSPESGDGDDANECPARTFAAGLPLSSDFLFTPLTHLLRSGASPVFRALPSDWTASETDVVRATLLLAYAAHRVLIAHGLQTFAHGAAETVFACMRVCMLEHGVGAGGTETEVFRDTGVERLMGWLLEPFTVRGQRAGGGGNDRHATTPPRTLEDASAPYLGATPFYQFYTDLVALYGAVSFGHPTFAALLVVPLAMPYAVDYRRALWCGGDGITPGSGSGRTDGGGAGLGDVVRSVRIPIEDVVCTVGSEGGDPREYLYPTERDSGVLGAYVAALVARDGAGAAGFLRLVAVHHVACAMWGDMGVDAGAETCTAEDERKGGEREGETGTGAKRWEAMRAGLLRAVLVRGEPDVVKDLVLYRQCTTTGAFVWPPACYRGGEDGSEGAGWRNERVAFVRSVMGESAAERVGALLMPMT